MGMSVPGNSCRTNTRCWAPSTGAGCLMTLPGTCVYYSGSNLSGPSINTGDTFNTVVVKLSQYISNFPGTVAAENGVSRVGDVIMLGNEVAGTESMLTSNREIPLNGFSVQFTNGVAGESVMISPNEINVGTDNHFSGANLIGNLVVSFTATSNVNTSQSVATGGSGKAGAIYSDTRFTYLDGITLTLRQPSLFGTAIDNVNANTTYNNWNGITGFTHSYSRISIGGPRRQTGYSGATTINYPSTLSSAMAVDRIQFNAEIDHAKTFTGHMAGMVLETKIAGNGTFNWYADLLLGRRHGENTSMIFTTRHGIYILPIKASNVTSAYSIYQEGATDQNFFAANVGIGLSANTFNNTSAKLQVDSISQGFLPPRMTEAQRDAIVTPAAGLIIYNTTSNKLNVRAAAAWEVITSV